MAVDGVFIVQDGPMMDQYSGYSTMEQPSYFSNQGHFVSSFAPVTPMPHNMGQGTGEPLPRQYHSPYNTTPGKCCDQLTQQQGCGQAEHRCKPIQPTSDPEASLEHCLHVEDILDSIGMMLMV